MPVLDSESALNAVGSFGRYQYLLAAFLWGLVGPLTGSLMTNQILLTLTPEHWCRPPPNHLWSNLTAADRKRLFIPASSRCSMYAVNASSLPSGPDPAWPVVACEYGWEYDHSVVYPTLVSQHDWVCHEAWKAYFVHTVFWIGSVFGVVCWGSLSDRFGRLPVIGACYALASLAGLATTFAWDFYSLLAFRCVVGFVYLTLSISPLVLVLEFVGPHHRMAVSTGYLFAFSIFISVASMGSYAMRDWKTFNVVTSLPLLSVALLANWIPESLRWLMGRGEEERIKRVLRTIARINGKQLDDDFFQQLKLQVPSRESASLVDAVKRPALRKIFAITMLSWLFVSVGYTGGNIYAASVSDNPFLMLVVNAGIDFVANGFADRLASRFGRRVPIIVSGVLSGSSYLSTAAIPSSLGVVVVSMFGRFALSLCYAITYLYGAEVYPTVVRSQALSLREAMGSLGNLVGPQIVLMSRYGRQIPLMVFGVLCVASALGMVWLPETLNKGLPETLSDGEGLSFADDRVLPSTPFAFGSYSISDAAKKRRPVHEIYAVVHI